MMEAGKALRKGYYKKLNGFLSYKTKNAPVFDFKVEGTPDLYVLLAAASDTDVSNKSRFAVVKNQDIEIFHLTNSVVQSEALDILANQILTLLIPSPGQAGFTIDAPFRLTFVRLSSANIEGVIRNEAGKFIHAKRITMANRITQ